MQTKDNQSEQKKKETSQEHHNTLRDKTKDKNICVIGVPEEIEQEIEIYLKK